MYVNLIGDPGEARTLDPLIKSQLLYQLSYGVVKHSFLRGFRITENGSIAPCDRCRIQTCNLLIRSQMLYSVELIGQAVSLISEDKGTIKIETCNTFHKKIFVVCVAIPKQKALFLCNLAS